MAPFGCAASRESRRLKCSVALQSPLPRASEQLPWYYLAVISGVFVAALPLAEEYKHASPARLRLFSVLYLFAVEKELTSLPPSCVVLVLCAVRATHKRTQWLIIPLHPVTARVTGSCTYTGCGDPASASKVGR